jgi:hypothetical protein
MEKTFSLSGGSFIVNNDKIIFVKRNPAGRPYKGKVYVTPYAHWVWAHRIHWDQGQRVRAAILSWVIMFGAILTFATVENLNHSILAMALLFSLGLMLFPILLLINDGRDLSRGIALMLALVWFFFALGYGVFRALWAIVGFFS